MRGGFFLTDCWPIVGCIGGLFVCLLLEIPLFGFEGGDGGYLSSLLNSVANELNSADLPNLVQDFSTIIILTNTQLQIQIVVNKQIIANIYSGYLA